MGEGVRVGIDIQHAGQQQGVSGVVVFVTTTPTVSPGHGGELTGLIVGEACDGLALRLDAVQAQPMRMFEVLKLKYPAVRARHMAQAALMGSGEGHGEQAVAQDGLQVAPATELQGSAVRQVPAPGDRI